MFFTKLVAVFRWSKQILTFDVFWWSRNNICYDTISITSNVLGLSIDKQVLHIVYIISGNTTFFSFFLVLYACDRSKCFRNKVINLNVFKFFNAYLNLMHFTDKFDINSLTKSFIYLNSVDFLHISHIHVFVGESKCN